MANVFETLEARGFLYQVSDPALKEILGKESVTVYAGFDPSGDGLHLGHLIPILGLMHFQREGHRPIAVVGGATGMIGDPSGKDAERELLTLDKIHHNQECIQKELERFLSFEGENAAIVVNNHDWIGPQSYLDFLRDVGKYFSVNAMIAKESVKKRLEDREQGISYTEFSYQLLQAYDFAYLNGTYGCRLQIGGSDQWGNVTAGIDLTRRLHGNQVYGATFPLLMTSAGKKFGKSEGNAIYLNPEKTRPYDLYQYFIQTDDQDVIKYGKLFTFMPEDELDELEKATAHKPEERRAQRRLAEEVTRLIHGGDTLEKVLKATEVLFGGKPIEGFDDADLTSIFKDTPSTEIPMDRLAEGIPCPDLLNDCGAAKSKGEGRRLVKQGGFYVNNNRVTDPATILKKEHLASETVMVLRTGKKKYYLIQFV